MRLALEHPKATISAKVVRSLVAFVERAGVPLDCLLHPAHLDDAHQSADGTRVTSAAFFAFCERALDLTGDPALALHWQESVVGGSALAPKVKSGTPTLGDALALVRCYGSLLSDEAHFDEVVLDDSIALRLIMPFCGRPRARRFASEFAMLGLHRLVCGFAPGMQPRVSFAYASPGHAAEYMRLFGRNVYFMQPYTELILDYQLLDARALQSRNDVDHAPSMVADQRMARPGAATTYAMRVREVLVAKGARETSMRDAASRLGMSVRTLRRRLDGEGVGYQQIAREAMSIIAKRFLRDQKLSIPQVACEMGFASASGFHRAFKHWTGRTPRAFRQQDEV